MMTYQRLERLKQIEADFEILIKNDRKNWIKVAKLLKQIELEELYLLRVSSFTQYVRLLSKENNINISTLWRARSAANVYMEISGIKDVAQLEERVIRTTPEQLEMYGKVRTIAPERIVMDLKERMLKGEGIRNELKGLWNTYRPLKRGKTERGRKKRFQEYMISPAESSQFLMPYDTQEQRANLMIAQNNYVEFKLDQGKLQKYQLSKEELLKANIANALRSASWAGYTFKITEHRPFAYFSKVQLKDDAYGGTRIDVAALYKPKEDEQLYILGASIRVNTSTLSNISFLMETEKYCHYYYIAVPMEEDFIAEAVKKIPRRIGLIGIDKTVGDTRHKLKIIRRAQPRSLSCENKNSILSALLQKQLGWE